MECSHFDTFLSEATCTDDAPDSALDADRLYGLYISWCFINQQPLSGESVFWAAMQGRIRPGANGLRMKGPAAADYIIASYAQLP